MEIDVAALQRLPELAEVAGLRPTKPIRCLPGKKTQIACQTKSCTKTIVIIHVSQ
jgi:hypothetical protein